MDANDGECRFARKKIWVQLQNTSQLTKRNGVNLRYKNCRYQFDQVVKVNIISEGTEQLDAIRFVMHRKEHCFWGTPWQECMNRA